MARAKLDKTKLLEALGTHVLDHGLNTASLRPMAAAAQTSDRMLIYHFGDKDGLIAAVLTHLAERMALGLDAAIPPRRYANDQALLRDIVAVMRSEPIQPYMRLWLDIVSGAAQGQETHRAAGGDIIDIYLRWIARRHPEGDAGAARMLTRVEGILVLEAVGRPGIVDLALRGPT